MRTAYFDCFSGAAGDMILAALLDAGCPLAALRDVVARLKLPGVALEAGKLTKQGISATQVRVHVPPEARKKHRHLPQIVRIIDEAQLDAAVAADAKRVFERLAQAEAQVHGTTPEKVHFHEVGAADAIVDIVGACAALRLLGAERVVCSPIPTGSGTVVCEHGVMPVPAPATANLLRGVPLAACDEPAELTTPTGAALLTTLAAGYGPLPAMRIDAVGYGAGSRDGTTRPNVLRVLIGDDAPHGAVRPEDAAAGETDVVSVLEANIDDATGQTLAHAAQLLMEAGALDVFFVPIIMKKGRPGQLLTVLCRPQDAGAMQAILFRETSTFGVRRRESVRRTLRRECVTVQTPHGPIRVKVGRRGDRVIRVAPEFEDCAAAARRAGVPLGEVQAAALDAFGRASPGAVDGGPASSGTELPR